MDSSRIPMGRQVIGKNLYPINKRLTFQSILYVIQIYFTVYTRNMHFG